MYVSQWSEDSLMVQFGESHIIYGFAEKQSMCPSVCRYSLRDNRHWERGKEFINFAASSLITGLQDENAGVAKGCCHWAFGTTWQEIFRGTGGKFS